MSITTTFTVEGMHCGSCSLLIDDALEDLTGVRSSQTSLKEGRSVVELDTAECTPEDVITTMKELGYTAVQQS